jgi:hypothetical protein|tara:strand:+ start:514 stop:633 length:120 start_codon:yes stop_codon:yes gene_type:complete
MDDDKSLGEIELLQILAKGAANTLLIVLVDLGILNLGSV